jgi:hypothetical protein
LHAGEEGQGTELFDEVARRLLRISLSFFVVLLAITLIDFTVWFYWALYLEPLAPWIFQLRLFVAR